MVLKEQQKLFVEEYLKLRCKNATQAAKNAGYSEKTAQSQASQLLMKANVSEYLEQRKKEIISELQQEFIFDAIEARQTMYEIMQKEDASDGNRISVAKDFLDRAGFKPEEKVNYDGDMDIRIIMDYGDRNVGNNVQQQSDI